MITPLAAAAFSAVDAVDAVVVGGCGISTTSAVCAAVFDSRKGKRKLFE